MARGVLTEALVNSVAMYAQTLQGRRVWLACSGGRDSLSMAILCRQLFDAGRLPFLPQLLHINHGMQEANTAWSQQVMAWAQAHDMPCQVLTLDLVDKSEQGARNARYQAMMEVMNAGDVLMLGHHQDDQVETVLMRLFSGAGVTGLGGMQVWSAKRSETKQVFLWRPWLTVSRAQITAYAQSQQLDYIDDPTNVIVIEDDEKAVDVDKLNDRAWLRSVLMPCLLQRYPQADEAIARSSQLMQSADSIIQQQVQTDLAVVVADDTENSWQSVLDIDKLQQLSSARQSALVHAWLAPTPEDLSPSKRLVDAVLDLAKRENPDHQTCLYWDSSGEQYQIRRYQQQLYRLSLAWDTWLEIEPIAQQLVVSSLATDLVVEKSVVANNVIANNKTKEGDKVDISSNLTSSLDLDRKLDLERKLDSHSLDSDSKRGILLKSLRSPNSSKTSKFCKQQSFKPQSLKKQVDFEWRLHGVSQVVALIRKQLPELLANIANADTETIASESNNFNTYLQFQPLPRQLKLALAGRAGRKAGKKLLQAIGQPSFMRASVVLCSLALDTLDTTQPAGTSQPAMALFIITTDEVVILQSPLAKQLQMMVANQQLYSQIHAQF